MNYSNNIRNMKPHRNERHNYEKKYIRMTAHFIAAKGHRNECYMCNNSKYLCAPPLKLKRFFFTGVFTVVHKPDILDHCKRCGVAVLHNTIFSKITLYTSVSVISHRAGKRFDRGGRHKIGNHNRHKKTEENPGKQWGIDLALVTTNRTPAIKSGTKINIQSGLRSAQAGARRR